MTFVDAMSLSFIWMLLAFGLLFAAHFTKVMVAALIGTIETDGGKVPAPFISRLLATAAAVVGLAITMWLVQFPVEVAVEIIRSFE